MTLTPKRITNAPVGSWVETRYSTIDPFSKDNTYLLLITQHHFELWDSNGTWLKSLPLSADSEPCWSRTDEHTLYYRWNNEIREFDVRTEVSQTLRKFPAPISGRGESDLSDDGEHLVLADDANRIWIYNVRTDDLRVGDIWPEPFNALYILPGNDVLVCAYTGVYLLSDGRKIAPSLAHNDVCRGSDGDDYLIRFNAGDGVADLMPHCTNGIEKVRIRDGKRTCIWPFGWAPQDKGGGPASYAGHISCPNGLPWVLVSLYSPMNAEPSRIYRAWLDGSKLELLCPTGSVMMRNDAGGMAYNPTPRASVSRDGSRVVFNSNSGQRDRGPNYVDVFMLTLEEARPVEPPKPEPPIDITLDVELRLNAEIVALQTDLTLARNAIIRAQEAARVATAQVMGLRRDMEALERRLADPEPDPDIWPVIDFLQRGHLPGQRWGFRLNDNGTLTMFDVMNGEWLAIAIPEGNQYLFVQTGDGIEQRERRTNQK